MSDQPPPFPPRRSFIDGFSELLEASSIGQGEGAPPEVHAWFGRVMKADKAPETAAEWAALRDPGPIPDNPTEAVKLAAEALARAAGVALWDRTSLPPDWYALYGYAQEIMHSIANLATVAIDNMPVAMAGKDVYVDDLGPALSLERVVGEWVTRTNMASWCLGEAAGHWGAAHSAVGRLGVRLPETEGD